MTDILVSGLPIYGWNFRVGRTRGREEDPEVPRLQLKSLLSLWRLCWRNEPDPFNFQNATTNKCWSSFENDAPGRSAG